MSKIFTLLTVLVAFGLIFGGVFLFSGVSSVDVSEDSVETLEPVVSQSHEECGGKGPCCEPPPPGYPDRCH